MKKITLENGTTVEISDESYKALEEGMKKLTYEEVAYDLFEGTSGYYIDNVGDVESYEATYGGSEYPNLGTKKQLEGLVALNKLMNVARYLNGDFNLNWLNSGEGKYYIRYSYSDGIFIGTNYICHNSTPYFKSNELALQAIEILGTAEVIKAITWSY